MFKSHQHTMLIFLLLLTTLPYHRTPSAHAQDIPQTTPPPTTKAHTSSCSITHTLTRGSQGDEVRCLQRFLIAQHLLVVNSVTGFFGILTQGAVQQFQSHHGIISHGTPATTGYGIVGKRTRTAITVSLVSRLTAVISTGTSTPQIARTPIVVPQPQTPPVILSGGGGGGTPVPPVPPIPQCTPDTLSPQTQTILCPTGQIGTTTQTRISSCALGATSPTWSGWGTTGNTCVVSAPTQCKIHIWNCPTNPSVISTYGTSFVDTYHATTSTQTECLARAQDYAYYCNTQLPTAASYWRDGALVAQQSYSIPLTGQSSLEQLPTNAGLINPLIQFGDGKVQNGGPELFPGYPSIVGFQPTSWFVTQWFKSDYMKPEIMSRFDLSTRDPVFGLASYAFSTVRYLSHVWMYPDPTDQQNQRLIFELFSTSGVLHPDGGSANHLSTWTTNPFISVTAPIYETFNVKLKNVVAHYIDPVTPVNPGSPVVSLFYSVMVVRFTDPVTASTTDAFLQILHSDSRQTSSFYSTKFANYFRDTINNGNANINYLALLPDDQSQYLSVPTPNDALMPMQFDVSKYLCDMAQTTFKTEIQGQPDFVFPPSARTLSNWKIASFAMGLETSDTILDTLGNPVPKGNAAMTVQISDLHLRKYPTLQSTYNGCTF